MKEAKIGKHKITMYDAVEELPIHRFHRFNKMILLDSGIGSDMSDVDKHLQKLALLIKSDLAQAVTEIENIRQNIYMVLSECSPKHLAFAALVTSIDGKECNDLSDEGLQRVVDMLSDAKNGEVAATLLAAKKKIDQEMTLYFPKMYEDARQKEYYDKVRNRILLQLTEILTGEDKTKEISAIEGELLTFNKPMKFTGKESAEVLFDKNFERLCVMITQNLGIEAKKLCVSEFYTAIETIQEQNKTKTK